MRRPVHRFRRHLEQAGEVLTLRGKPDHIASDSLLHGYALGPCGAPDLQRGELRVGAADYKTDRIDGDPAAAAARYRPQVDTYVEALRRALPGAEVRGEILFVRHGTAVTLE